MTTRREIIEYCLTFPAAYEDYPFAGLPSNGEITVMRHQMNKPSFAMILNHDGKLYAGMFTQIFISNPIICPYTYGKID